MAAFAADKRRLVLSTWSANTKYPKSVGRTTSGTPRSQRAPISVRYRISKRRRNSVFGHIARLCEDTSDEYLTFSDLISSLSKSCYSHIQELRCIRPYLDSKTASAIAASIVHSKLDYCNSLYYNLPKSQINRLQQIQNCLARTVVKAPKSSLITPILRSLHWLNINERIEYKLLSLTVPTKFLQPANLTTLISVQSSGRTRASSVVNLARPSVSSSIQITNRSFTYASPFLWNQ